VRKQPTREATKQNTAKATIENPSTQPLPPIHLFFFFLFSPSSPPLSEKKHPTRTTVAFQKPSMFSFHLSFLEKPGLRGLSKYVVNDGVTTRVDYENEEGKEVEEEEDVVVVECRGSKRDCTTFEASHFYFI
jgi:hypothetical protein